MSSCRSLALRDLLPTVLPGAAVSTAPYLRSTAAEPLVHAVDGNLTSGRTSTATPTPTATPGKRGCYPPLLLLIYGASPTPAPTASATPTLAPARMFTCSKLWRQSVTSDRPTVDWHGSINFALRQELTTETSNAAVIEALAGASVRIETLYGGAWLVACKSVAFCEP